MKNYITIAGLVRIVPVLCVLGTAVPSVEAYIHYKLSDEYFHPVIFDEASEVLYAVNAKDGVIYRWRASSQQSLSSIAPPEGSKTVAILLEKDLAISVGSVYETSGKHYVWKLSDGKSIVTLSGEREDKFIAISGDGSTYATHNGSVISLWTLPNGEKGRGLIGHSKDVHVATFSRDGRVLASAGYGEAVRLWDVQSGQLNGTLNEAADLLLFSPDGSFLLTSYGELGLVWDVQLSVPVARFELSETIKGMAFSPDGRQLLVVDYDGIHRWNYDPTQFLRAKPATATDRIAMLSSQQKQQRLQALPRLEFHHWSSGFSGSDFTISPSARWIASTNSTLQLCDAASLDLVESTAPRKTLRLAENVGEKNWSKKFEFVTSSPDSKRLASMREGNVVDLWDVDAGNHLRTWTNEWLSDSGPGFSVESVSFSSDSSSLYMHLRGYKAAKVIDLMNNREVFTAQYTSDFYKRLQKPWDGARESDDCPIVFAPDGTKLVYVGPWDNQPLLFDVAKKKASRPYFDPSQVMPDRKSLFDDGEITSVAFSHDGKKLATGYEIGMVKIWDTANGKWLGNLLDPAEREVSSFAREQRSHSGSVCGVAFSPNGDELVTSDEYTLKVWNAKTGTLVRSARGNFGKLALSQDGRLITTRGKCNVWTTSSLENQAQLESICNGTYAFSSDGNYLATISKDNEAIALIDGEPCGGLFHTSEISRPDVRWLGRTLTDCGYLNSKAKLRAAAYRAEDIGHIAITLPSGATTDEVILAAIRDEVGPLIAERLGPKLAIHLCNEYFQVERTIDVERPLIESNDENLASPPIEVPIATVSNTTIEAAPQTADDLRGAWRVKSMAVNGKPRSFDKNIVYRFDDGRLTVETKAAPSASFTYTIDDTVIPKRLEMLLIRPSGEELSQMIYKIEGNLLTVCFGPPGSDYPVAFPPQTKAERTLITFHRITETP